MLGPEAQSLAGGGLLVVAGRIERVLATPAAVRRAAATRHVDLGPGVLVPGLVNAHAHLELGCLAGRIAHGLDFGRWVRELVSLRRAATSDELARAARAGAQRLLATGTTSVGDIDTAGGALRGLARPPLRVRQYRELLDVGDPARTTAALRRVARPLRATALRAEGLAPHAPYSASPALLAATARLARARKLPVTVHWAETDVEELWLRDGSGPLAEILGESPRQRGLALLERAGLCSPRLALVHGNHPAPGELARVARAGATLVHCPGSHAFFARSPAPLMAFLKAGVELALGTDALASNDDLDLFREMALLRASHPGIAPRRVWRMATLGGARALCWQGQVGELRPGAWADFVLLDAQARDDDALLDALTAGEKRILGVWVGAKRARGSVRVARSKGPRVQPQRVGGMVSGRA